MSFALLKFSIIMLHVAELIDKHFGITSFKFRNIPVMMPINLIGPVLYLKLDHQA